jgi:serine/threonine protein kinase/formylglycine-generating enzyme required for sulfatase activity
MTEKRTCPDRSRLESLLAGSLSEAEQGAVTEHVEGCASCQKTLEILAGTSREEQARHLADPPPTLDPALKQVMSDALSGETQAAEVRTGGDEALAFLAPPREPGHLGRLKHYEVLELVGQGGFGLVFKAFDEKLQRVVAIKVLAPELAASATARKRFVREAQAAAAVRNEHVIAIYEVADEHQPPFLVMEYIAGISLQDRLDREGPLPPREVLRIGMQAAEGLAAAHKQGLVHRDIKPANVLLENGVQRVKITDFGLARAVDDASLSQSGVIAGTPMYMSPEQAQGEALDHRSDLFSLGSVLYALCTGRPPFRASGTMAVLKRVCEESARPIRESNPEVPEWLCAVIERLQAKKAGDRFGSARELADLLQRYLAHLQHPGGELPPPSYVGPERAPSLPHRKRGRRALAAAALLLVLAVATGLAWQHLVPHGNSPPHDDPGPPSPDTPALAVAPFDEKQAKQHQEAWARYLGVDVEITNAIGMKLRLIPPGEFTMGSSPEEIKRAVAQVPEAEKHQPEDEGPARRVRIDNPCYFGVHKVTVGEFRKFVKDTGYKTFPETDGLGSWGWTGTTVERSPKYVWQAPEFVTSDKLPVVCIEYADAQAFCGWLSRIDGRRYEIPHEPVWEYACRAGTTGLWPWGDQPDGFEDHAFWDRHPVGQKPANAFGLYDTIGNVAEFARADGSPYVIRGASGRPNPWLNRSAYRVCDWGMFKSGFANGFRVAIVGDLKPKAPLTKTDELMKAR